MADFLLDTSPDTVFADTMRGDRSTRMRAMIRIERKIRDKIKLPAFRGV
jgi:hypothetical protein